MRWCWCVWWIGCGGSQPLQPDLDGTWDITFAVQSLDTSRVGSADLSWNEELAELAGEVTMVEPDGPRLYDVIEAEDIASLGVALQLAERTGIRLLFAEVAPPEQGATFGSWRTRWASTECIPDGCGEDGTMTLQRSGGASAP
ncbi:MAG: hypothetical protein KTR31_06600 [Myxococcales bacterium]|nr:hypothetical protein [Myxococcales bacterium]